MEGRFYTEVVLFVRGGTGEEIGGEIQTLEIELKGDLEKCDLEGVEGGGDFEEVDAFVFIQICFCVSFLCLYDKEDVS